ncbi:type II secretion system F family protein [Vibrio ziniensis]|uniref:Type II secretion system F family protein n=1 Tax=Vibrio ziniensis TaxID=2711221 RepID=A0A6G7CFQ1_9VIBR|nr:type II secretion system F family protein [Vibrio ziniensis]QIH40893.1 type II secretion system F family protein [Vibrio ziniensis]
MRQRSTPQLSNFVWKGINCHGKRVSGRILAMTENDVRKKLSEQHIQVRKTKKYRISVFTRLFHRIRAKDITLLTRQLSTMLTTGVPLVQALKIIASHHSKVEMKLVLSLISQGVESGTPISKTLRNTSTYFDSLYIDLVKTGEQVGNLAGIFDRLATYREKSEELKSKVIKALIYPITVLLVALGVSYLMLTLVIPEFESMFSNLGAELPWFTQQVLKLSHAIQTYSLVIVFILILSFIVFRTVRQKSLAFRLKTSRFGLKCPVLGAVLTKAAIAKFSRTLATSFSSGIPILSGLKTTAKTAGIVYFEYAIDEVQNDIASGMPMHIAMRNTEAFPEMVLQMVMIGEESGKLDEMLNKIASIYELEVDNTVDNLGKILEPLLILFLGVVVGGLVIAMYLPIFNLMSVLG